MKDPDNYWAGIYVGSLGFASNKNFLEKHQLKPPTFKGSECTERFFVLRALHTTRSRGPVRHRAAGDGVVGHISARPLDHLSRIGLGPLGQTMPPPPPPLVSLSRLCSLVSAGPA